MNGAEELANKFENETIKVLEEVYKSEEYKDETQKFFASMDSTFRNC